MAELGREDQTRSYVKNIYRQASLCENTPIFRRQLLAPDYVASLVDVIIHR
jgi:hypothetical protein